MAQLQPVWRARLGSAPALGHAPRRSVPAQGLDQEGAQYSAEQRESGRILGGVVTLRGAEEEEEEDTEDYGIR